MIGGVIVADCSVAIQTVFFDISDPEITHVKVTCKWYDDHPIQVKNKYEKSFPARIQIRDLIIDEVPKFTSW